MVSILKKILLGLVICGGLFGQTQNSIYITLFTNATSIPVTGVMPNIGQVTHIVGLQFTNNGANTCLAPVVVGELEYSFDNTTFLPFGQTQPTNPQILNFVWTGSGLFPYVRFKLSSFDSTNCKATANYVGSTNYTNLSQINCNSNTVLTSFQGATVTAVANTNTLASTKICGLNLTNNSTTAVTVSLYQQVNGSACVGSVTPSFGQWIMPAGGSLNLGSGQGLLFVLNAHTDFCLSATGVSAGASVFGNSVFLTN